jgi:hypothetical protein
VEVHGRTRPTASRVRVVVDDRDVQPEVAEGRRKRRKAAHTEARRPRRNCFGAVEEGLKE